MGVRFTNFAGNDAPLRTCFPVSENSSTNIDGKRIGETGEKDEGTQ